MEYFSRWQGAALLFAVSALPLSAADALWEQAMKHASLGYADAALSMTMESWQTDRDGEVTSTSTTLVGRDEETWEWRVISAMEDGKDVTDRERRKAEKQQEDGSNRQYIHPMFDPQKADGLTLTPRETTAVIHGMNCRIYDFRFENEWSMGSGKPKAVAEEGILFLALENGMPLRIDSALVESPRMIHSVTYALDAHPGPGDDWQVDRMDMEYAGRMFVRRSGGVRIRFEYEGG